MGLGFGVSFGVGFGVDFGVGFDHMRQYTEAVGLGHLEDGHELLHRAAVVGVSHEPLELGDALEGEARHDLPPRLLFHTLVRVGVEVGVGVGVRVRVRVRVKGGFEVEIGIRVWVWVWVGVRTRVTWPTSSSTTASAPILSSLSTMTHTKGNWSAAMPNLVRMAESTRRELTLRPTSVDLMPG